MLSVAKHAVPCKNGKCVLPECVNLKLRREITNNARRLKRPGRSQIMSRRNSGNNKNQSPEVIEIEAQEEAGKAWEEDLEDILDILRQETFESFYRILAEPRRFDDSSTLTTLPSLQQLKTQQMAEIHTITSPAVHSNDLDFSGTKNEGIAPETFASSAPNSSNLMIDLANTFHTPYTQDYARFGGKTGTVEVSFTSDQPQSLPQGDDNRITPQTNRKVTSPRRSNHTKLFGVLSLILQVFNTHLTAESEEFCTSVLRRALAEI
ncbi:unnamed protein product, partial [Pocillopora meandrina]